MECSEHEERGSGPDSKLTAVRKWVKWALEKQADNEGWHPDISELKKIVD